MKEGIILQTLRKILEMRNIEYIADKAKFKKPDNIIKKPYILIKLPYEPEEEILIKIPYMILNYPILLDYKSDYKFI